MKFCLYYQASINKSLTWFFVATFRSFEHIGFDRTYDVEQGIFEFFVPEDLQYDFLFIMKNYEGMKIVSNLKQLPNRFQKKMEGDF